ncbi:hypothetical protein LCGC14_2338530, partial [marine sediment metagenome]
RQQNLARNDFLQAVRAWHDLTDKEHDAWDALARSFPITNRLGLTTYLSGFQIFLKDSINIQWFPFYPRATPPFPTQTNPFLSVELDFTEGGPYNITTIQQPMPSPSQHLVYIHRSMSSTSRSVFNSHLFVQSQVATLITVDWKFWIEFNVGPLRLEERVSIKSVQWNPDNFRSPPFYAATNVHA